MVEITVGGRCQLQGSEADVVESLVVSSVFSTTENMFMVLSGYSSLILEMRSFPMPDPVPPPREWVSWKPYTSYKIVMRILSSNFKWFKTVDL